MSNERRRGERSERMRSRHVLTYASFPFAPSPAPRCARSTQVKRVYHPSSTTPGRYDEFRRPTGGYGGLFSITLHSLDSSVDFFDRLPIAKGPSLGTNFTLACPYTILAHYQELDWAAGCGVEAGLIRVSVGLEGVNWLIEAFKKALEGAKGAEGEVARQKPVIDMVRT